MKNKKQLIQLLLLILFAIYGCATLSSTNIPNTPLVSTPQYLHYDSPTKFNIHIEFNYPSNWILKENIDNIGFVTISLGDPRFQLLPTITSDTLHPTPSDLSSINILVLPSEYSQTPESKIDSVIQGYANISRIKILRDYQVEIGGYLAKVLEYQTDDKETSPSIMFNKRIYFMVEGKLYEIYFKVANKDRGNEFEQGYEYFIDSLRITP